MRKYRVPRASWFFLILTAFVLNGCGGGSSSFVHPLQPVVTTVSFFSVCDRTPAIRDAITNQFTSINSCEYIYQINLDSVESLVVTRKGLQSLKARDFDNLVNLKWLYIDRNSLVDLPENIFSHLGQLEHLVMDKNKMTTLKSGQFKDLPNLKALWIGQPELVHLPDDVFDDLPNLERLYIQRSKLTSLAESMFAQNPNLRTLWMSNNQLETLPSNIFANLQNLEVLSLTGNALRQLPAQLFVNTPNLEEIRLGRNAIGELDHRAFSNLSKLKYLDMQEENLSSVPDSLYELSSLEVLNLRGNRIGEIRPLQNFVALRELNLEYNKLDSLPPRFMHSLNEIRQLFLRGNPGSPFEVDLIVHRTDGENISQSPASLVVRLHEESIFDSLPFDWVVELEAQNGTISTTELTIAAGKNSSSAFTATRESDENATYVYLVDAGPLPIYFSGLDIRANASIALFLEDGNSLPETVGRIRTHVLTVDHPLNLHLVREDGEVVEADVSTFFEDEESDSLSYEVISSDESALTASVFGTQLHLTPKSPGDVEVTLRGMDDANLYAIQQFNVTINSKPDPNGFKIDLVFTSSTTEGQRQATVRAAERWSELIVSELTDVDFSKAPNATACVISPTTPIFGDVLDDLRVFVDYGPNQPRGGPLSVRLDSGKPIEGCIWLSIYSDHGDSEEEADEKDHWTSIHEIAHVLGFGTLWRRHGLLHDITTVSNIGQADTHFTGPLALQAFDSAGGDAYTAGKKVPVANSSLQSANGHWRSGWSSYRVGKVIYYDEMSGPGADWVDTAGVSEYQPVLSAITLQSLADLGYEVDVSKADEFKVTPAPLLTLEPPQANQPLEAANDIVDLPIQVVDELGRVVSEN